MPREELHEKLSRRLITGDQLMLAHVYLKKGCVVPRHSHMNEQLTYILEGALKFFVGDDGSQEVVVRAGEVLHLPGNLPHEAHALEDTLDVDVFYPPREDWLKKTDASLKKWAGAASPAFCPAPPPQPAALRDRDRSTPASARESRPRRSSRPIP